MLVDRIRGVLTGRKPTSDTTGPAAPEEPGRDALAWARAGEVGVVGPGAGGHYAAIVAGDGVSLRVNGKECRTAALCQGDQVEAHPCVPFEEIAPAIEITVSEGGGSATAAVVAGRRIRRWLADSGRVERLHLSLESAEEAIHATAKDVCQALDEAGVVWGVDQVAIGELVDAARGEAAASAVVARAAPPSPGKALGAAFDPSLPRDQAGQFVVQTGKRLAVICQPEPGTPGHKVTGEAIEPPPAAERRLDLGSGVRRSEGVLYAETDGRVIHRTEAGRLFLDVVPLHLFPHGLTGQSVVEDHGEMLVLGDVDGSGIQTVGRLDILGAVSESSLAARDIHVAQSIAHSVAQAGTRPAGLPAERELQNVALFLDTLVEAYQKAVGMDPQGRKFGFHPLVHVLSQRTFTSIRDDLEACGRFGLGLPADLWEQVASLLAGSATQADPEYVKGLAARARQIVSSLNATPEEHVCLHARSAVKARLASLGHIHLERGAEESEIRALGLVLCEGTIRGGHIASRRGVVVGTLGSSMAMDTEIELTRGDVVARQIYPGVRVSIDGQRLRLAEATGPCRILAGPERLELSHADFETAFDEKMSCLCMDAPYPEPPAP